MLMTCDVKNSQNVKYILITIRMILFKKFKTKKNNLPDPAFYLYADPDLYLGLAQHS